MDFSTLDKFLDEHLWYYGLYGCDLAVTYKGQTVYRKQLGIDDIETGKKINGDELYYIFSASKPVTCAGALRLVERGLLELDAPVSRYIPEFENVKILTPDGVVKAKNVMTVKHLFTMTAGYDYNIYCEAVDKLRGKNPNFTSRELAAALSEFPLHFEPGTDFLYSLCHDILAGVVEAVTDMRFCEYQKKNIFEPLGMTRTCFHADGLDEKLFATQYLYDNGEKKCRKIPLKCEYTLSPNHDSGGAGMICCTDDYMKFVCAMSLGGTSKDGYQLLKRETVDLMRKNHLPYNVERKFIRRMLGYSYGLGVRTMVDKNAQHAKSPVGEFGWDGAASAYVLIDPDNQVGVYYAQNVRDCGYMYHIGHPALRDHIYKALEL